MSQSRREPVFKHKTFCFVTGASRGYGRRLAERFALRLPTGSFLLITARDGTGLAEAKKEIEMHRSDIGVEIWACDLTTVKYGQIEEILRSLISDPSIYDQAILVHNAGSMGDVTKLTVQMADAETLDNFWSFNLTSLLLLNSVFWKVFSEAVVPRRMIIHVTSICAKQPFKSMALYCAAKAARNMLMCTLAEESPSIRVLNYAPGPLDTDMHAEVRNHAADDDIRNMFIAMKADGSILSLDQSIDRLMTLLDRNTFESGDHIDYYDVAMHESISLNTEDDLEALLLVISRPPGKGLLKMQKCSEN